MHNINYAVQIAKTTRNATTMSAIKQYRLSKEDPGYIAICINI
jgi:hypothetical protein